MPFTRIISTDEISRLSAAVSDAYDNQIELTQYLGAGTGTPVVEARRYDRLGRLTGITDPQGSVWTYNIGRLTTWMRSASDSACLVQ